MPQSLSAIYIHSIFSTKERRPFLTDPAIRRELHAYIASILQNHGCPPILIGGPTDHIHALFLLARKMAPADITAEMKRASSIWINTKGAEFDKFQWQSGYGAFSVSYSNTSRVRAYIADQEQHHATVSFQDEFRAFLRRHNVEYDEQYVWD